MCPDTPDGKAEMAKVPYREPIGKLLNLALAVVTCPDIAYIAGVLYHFVENLGCPTLGRRQTPLRYLKGTVAFKHIYLDSTSPDHFVTYSDADLSDHPDNSRSMGNFAVSVLCGWVVAQHSGSTESGYTIALSEIMWTLYFYEELGHDMSSPRSLAYTPLQQVGDSRHQAPRTPKYHEACTSGLPLDS